MWKCSAEVAYRPFIGIEPPLIPFRDAAFCVNTFPCTPLDCARAAHRAVSLGHFDFSAFSLETFQAQKLMQNGDLSWIIPGKFVAFSGPLSKRRELGGGALSMIPEEYVPVFKNIGVTCIIRFNSKCYDRNVFVNAGIRHVDLYYEDGANPSESILQSFLQICENEKGAIAVHCKAGLGRTGTNIAAYMMKHYGYTARESIAWCRMCRPGSVVGPQQQYLVSIEEKMRAEGEAFYRQRDMKRSSFLSPVPEEVDQQKESFTFVQVSSSLKSSASSNTIATVLETSQDDSKPSSLKMDHTPHHESPITQTIHSTPIAAAGSAAGTNNTMGLLRQVLTRAGGSVKGSSEAPVQAQAGSRPGSEEASLSSSTNTSRKSSMTTAGQSSLTGVITQGLAQGLASLSLRSIRDSRESVSLPTSGRAGKIEPLLLISGLYFVCALLCLV